MILWAVCLAVEAAAAALAWRHVRRCRDGTISLPPLSFPPSRPPAAALALLLAFAVASDVIIKLGQLLVLDAAPRPFVGLARGLYFLETALVTAWPVSVAAIAWAVFGGWSSTSGKAVNFSRIGQLFDRFPLVVFGSAWGLAVVVFVAAFPLPRGMTAPLLRAWTLLAVVAGVAAVVRAWRFPEPWGRSAVHHAVLLLLGTEAAVAIVGPYAGNVFADWDAARLLYVVGFGAVCVVLSRVAFRPESAR